MKKFVLLIAGVLSMNAYAGLEQEVPDPDTFATDIFGASTVTVQSSAQVVLRFNDISVSKDNVADVTYTLSDGATFGSVVSVTDFVHIGPISKFSWSIKAGGGIGDKSVTITVTTTADVEPVNGSNNGFVFQVDTLTNLKALADDDEAIEIIISVAPVTASGNDGWPSTVAVKSKTIAKSEHALDIDDRGRAWLPRRIPLDDRTIIENGTKIDHDNDSKTPDIKSLTLGQISIELEKVSDHEGIEFTFDKSGKGNLTFNITGNFNKGDVICVKIRQGKSFGDCISIPIVDNTATYKADLDKIFDTKMYYVPSGGGTLTPGRYITKITLLYDSPTHINTLYDPIDWKASLRFRDIHPDGEASAIPSSKSADNVFIRVTNRQNRENFLFGLAFTQTGEELGLEELAKLKPYETKIFKAEDLEKIFGTWTGRARIEFLTDGDISVKTLVRSGGTLTNLSSSTGAGDGCN